MCVIGGVSFVLEANSAHKPTLNSTLNFRSNHINQSGGSMMWKGEAKEVGKKVQRENSEE